MIYNLELFSHNYKMHEATLCKQSSFFNFYEEERYDLSHRYAGEM